MGSGVFSSPIEDLPCWLPSLGDESRFSDRALSLPDEELPWWLSSLGDKSRLSGGVFSSPDFRVALMALISR